MRVNRQTVALILTDYLYHRITLSQFVDCAEWAVMDADFDARDMNLLREILAGWAGRRARISALTWDDCEDYLSQLGYRVSVTVSEVPVLA